MAYIRALANGHYRADIRMKGIFKNKTFLSQSLAQACAIYQRFLTHGTNGRIMRF